VLTMQAEVAGWGRPTASLGFMEIVAMGVLVTFEKLRSVRVLRNNLAMGAARTCDHSPPPTTSRVCMLIASRLLSEFSTGRRMAGYDPLE